MIVSNTSPLRHLIAVGQADLIQKLFGKVLIPPAVQAELTHPSGRADVRKWMEQHPSWLTVRDLQSRPSPDLIASLDPGESEAIQLSLETDSDFILIDERLGRKAAARLGFTVIGALGLLREGYRKQQITNPLDILDEMRRVGFRISTSLCLDFQRQIELIERDRQGT